MSTQVKTPFTAYRGKEFLGSKGYIRRDSWTAPAAASTTAVHVAVNSNAVITTGITNPDFPRNITIVGAGSGHAATGTVVINGTNIRDQVISETLTLNSNTTVAGNKAFKTVTSIDMTGVSGNDANDTVAVGIGTKFGLAKKLVENSVLLSCTDTSQDTLPTVATSSSAVESNTVIFNTAPNASHNYSVIYVATELVSL